MPQPATEFEGTIPTAANAPHGAVPKPINFGAAQALSRRAFEAHARLTQRLEAAEAQRARDAEQRRIADGIGYERGLREGFTTGTHWGIFCGVVGTLLFGGITIVGVVTMLGRHVPALW